MALEHAKQSIQHVHMQYKYVDSKYRCHLDAGTIQNGEQQHQAATRTVKQLTGVTVEESSIKPIHGTSRGLQAHTCKQETKSTASGLGLLKVFSVVAGSLGHSAIHEIDLNTVTPFLLQGKARECANEVRLQAHEVETVLANFPPLLQLDQANIVDAKWFNRRWLIAQSKGSPPLEKCRMHTPVSGHAPSPFLAHPVHLQCT